MASKVSWELFHEKLVDVENDAREELQELRAQAATVHGKDRTGHDSSVVAAASTGDWYNETYCAFVHRAQTLEAADDFSVVAAFAYSWAAGIPTRSPSSAWGALSPSLTKLQDARLDYPGQIGKSRRSLVKEVMKHFTGDHGVIMASKILHFIAPERVPIIDSRVGMAWNRVRDKLATSPADPQMPLKLGETPGEISVKRFIDYWEILDQWKRSMPRPRGYRDLEGQIFRVGKLLAEIKAEKRARKKRNS